MLLSHRLLRAQIFSIVIFLILGICDATAARRGVRVDFLAWTEKTPIDSCAGYSYSYYSLNLENVRFYTSMTLGFGEEWIPYSYCQDSKPWSEGLATNEYLNSEVFEEDESVLANEIGSNNSENPGQNVTARKYSYLNEFGFGYQWAFYDFPSGLTLVGYYSSSIDQSPRIESADGSITLWESAYDGEYFCFENGVFIGISDGGTFCQNQSVLAWERDALVALYNSTNGANWQSNDNWLIGDPCQNSWYGVTCRKLEEWEAEEDGGFTIVRLELDRNSLAGSIPESLGNLTNLEELYLDSNKLTGLIPESLGYLEFLWSINLGWNGLQTENADLDSFLDALDSGGDWSITQTVPPANLVVASVGPTSISLAWDAIEYTGDTGRYRVWYSTSPSGPFSDGGTTDSKLDTTHTVTGLTGGIPYYLFVRSETDSNDNNDNDVVSEASELLNSAVILINGFE